jgi:hypothetical protein
MAKFSEKGSGNAFPVEEAVFSALSEERFLSREGRVRLALWLPHRAVNTFGKALSPR